MYCKKQVLMIITLAGSLSPAFASVVKQSSSLKSILNDSASVKKESSLNSRSTRLNKILLKQGKLEETVLDDSNFKFSESLVQKESTDSKPLPQLKQYLALVDKGLTSIEEDSWVDAIDKTKKQLVFFENELQKDKDSKIVEAFLELSIAFNKFSEAGELMDEEKPSFDEAKILYLQSKLSAGKAKSLGEEFLIGQEFLNYVGILEKYIQEELVYVNETISDG